MSHRPGYYRDYYRANRERELARLKAWRDANIEHCRAVEAAWRKANPEVVAAAQRRHRQKPEVKAKDAEAHREKRKANPARAKDKDRLYRLRKKARMAADPELYAHFRALKNAAKRRYDAKMAEIPERYARDRRHKRMTYARKVIRAGKTYSAQPNRRVPDWCVKRRVLDVRSPWLAENLTPSQCAYARELAIERKSWRDR